MNTRQKMNFYRSLVEKERGQWNGNCHYCKQYGKTCAHCENAQKITWRKFATKNHYFTKSIAKRDFVYNSVIENTTKRWIENTQKAGLRFVDFADKIINLRHTGWFIDSYQSDTYRGAVWQLPSRKKQQIFVYGYVDCNNENAAFIDFDHTDTKEQAARYADNMAEYDAKESCETFAKDQAAVLIQGHKETIAENKKQIRVLLAERRKLKQLGNNAIVCDLFKEKVSSLLSYNTKLHSHIADLTDNFWLSVEQ